MGTWTRFIIGFTDLHVCPNSGKILTSPKSDDKVLCSCGIVNPRNSTEPRNLHTKLFLETATVDEFLTQELIND
jgi:hypothetical protein